MAMRWNWRKIGFGSGALIAAISTAYAYSPGNGDTMHDKRSGLGMTHQARHPVSVAYMKSGDPRVVQLDKDRILHDAIQNSRALCERIKTEKGLPGLTVAVSVNGEVVWKEGFGLSNLENGVPMKPESIMRIASISKSITMAMLAKLMEEGKIDIDKPIQTYLPNYPEKYVDGEKVTITTRHLLSHLSGIRHYHKKPEEPSQKNGNGNVIDQNVTVDNKSSEKKTDKSKRKKKKKDEKNEFDLQEYYLKEKFESIEDAIKLFQDDELFHKPGSKYLYTTHGWTVVSAIIEELTDVDFPKYCVRMFDFWGLKNTFLDEHEPIIYNRANYYCRKNGVITNSPYVDNSYKWAGGGFLSNVIDLTQFANILIYSMQTPDDDANSIKTCEKGLPQTPFLKQSTMKTIWTGNPLSSTPYLPDMLYALGFRVGEPLRKCMFCKERDLMVVQHSGGAIGASSILLLAFPVTKEANCCDDNSKLNVLKDSTQSVAKVNGVVVAMITNLTSVGFSKTAQEIADYFKGLI